MFRLGHPAQNVTQSPPCETGTSGTQIHFQELVSGPPARHLISPEEIKDAPFVPDSPNSADPLRATVSSPAPHHRFDRYLASFPSCIRPFGGPVKSSPEISRLSGNRLFVSTTTVGNGTRNRPMQCLMSLYGRTTSRYCSTCRPSAVASILAWNTVSGNRYRKKNIDANPKKNNVLDVGSTRTL